MVEPDKILDSNSPFSTIKVACISIEKLASSSGGIFFHRNPLTYQTPLMMLQLSLASVVIMLTAFLLKPLGQPLMASQMLGGIILGPSFLGQKASIRNALFPTASLVMLDLLAVFGVMFYFFLVGVQMDPWIIKKSGKKSMAIGIAVVISSLTFSAFSYILVMAFMHPDPMSSHSIPFTGAAEAMVTFPAIAFFLSELKILNSDFGRLALSSSMVSGLVGAVLFTTTFLKPSSHRTDPSSIHKFATAIVLAMVIFFVFRPAVLWKIRRCSKGETVTQGFIYSILVTVLVTGFISQYVGHHVMFGPFFSGHGYTCWATFRISSCEETRNYYFRDALATLLRQEWADHRCICREVDTVRGGGICDPIWLCGEIFRSLFTCPLLSDASAGCHITRANHERPRCS